MSSSGSNTQPMYLDHPPKPEVGDKKNEVWGWLIPQSEGLVSVLLKNPTVCAGRDGEACAIVFKSEIFHGKGDDIEVDKVSRVHFQLAYDPTEEKTVLEDLSMNGTWVNGARVGRKNTMVLDHGSTISILSPNLSVFCYLDSSSMFRTFPQSLTSKYLVGKKLGEGATATVYLGYSRNNELSEVALKIIATASWPSKYSEPVHMTSEVDILANLDHPCITKVMEVISCEKITTIVMEYAKGGELFDRLVDDHNKNNLSERMAKFQFYQIVEAVRYLHSRQVCHRDLKLENLLLADNGENPLIKVSDFGLSKQWSNVSLHSYVGTPVYMAPEVLTVALGNGYSTSYTSKADCWSLGVILYLLLCCRHPFNQGDSLFRCIIEGRFNSMHGSPWDNVSDSAKNLVRALLEVDPSKRLDTEQILKHSWFTEDYDTVQASKRTMWGAEALEVAHTGDSGVDLRSFKKMKTDLNYNLEV